MEGSVGTYLTSVARDYSGRMKFPSSYNPSRWMEVDWYSERDLCMYLRWIQSSWRYCENVMMPSSPAIWGGIKCWSWCPGITIRLACGGLSQSTYMYDM